MVIHPDTLRYVAVKTSWAGLVSAVMLLVGLSAYATSLAALANHARGAAGQARKRGGVVFWVACLTAGIWLAAGASAYLFVSW